MRDLYSEVTRRIVAELIVGVVPWRQPWSATPGLNVPCNAVTNRKYHGVNRVLLWLTRSEGWPTPRFLTFKQALELGGHVRKGEHGTKVYFVKDLKFTDASEVEGDEPGVRLAHMLREYTVFNVAQCEELPARVTDPPITPPRHRDARDPLIEEFLAATKATIREGDTGAKFISSLDIIAAAIWLIRQRKRLLRHPIPRARALDRLQVAA